MNILDEWEHEAAGTYAGAQIPADDGLGDTDLDDPFERLQGFSAEAPLFAVDAIDRQLARGRGQIVALAAASDCIVAATARAYLLRYDLSQGSALVAEVELSRVAGAAVRGLFLDPSACHTLAVLQTGTTLETHYLHSRWKKSRVLAKLKGLHLTAVAWDAAHVSEHNTSEVLLGSRAGALHELLVEEKEKKERHFKQLLQLREARREPFTGLAQVQLPGREQVLVLAATPTRLYAFQGGPLLEGVFATYSGPSPAAPMDFIEAPDGQAGPGSLHTHTPTGLTAPERFAWRTAGGLHHGRLLPEPPAAGSGGALDYLADQTLTPYAALHSSSTEPLLSVAVTQYHLLLLYPSRLLVVNAVSQQAVQDIALHPRTLPAWAGTPVGLAPDATAGTLYLHTGEGLYEVAVQEEGRDMWRVYLEAGDFPAAFAACRTQAQRDKVNIAEAEALFADAKYEQAASLYGKVTAAQPSFEELALKFVEVAETKALQAFLLTKLQCLGPDDKAQATMVATWLTELYLDQINRALLEEGGEASPAAAALTQQLRAFLQTNVAILDTGVTVTMLAGYGRLDDLMHFATYRQDNETVLEHLVQAGQAARALAILRRPAVSHELFYKFAPALLTAAPADTVEAWITAHPPLEPRRLLPALLRFGEEGAPEECRREAVRYVQHCIGRLGCEDPAIHQLAVALFSLDAGEERLLAYLASAHNPLGRPLYDPHTALRICRTRHRMQASVELLCEVGMWEDAVALALGFNMALALRTAKRPEGEAQRGLQRRLWLAIARHLIASPGPEGQDLTRINEFLREAGGAVKIEDILPLFPDFVQIDNFKEAICASLEDYNNQIEELRTEMEDATRIADALRKDISALEQRSATVDLAEPCARCALPLQERPPPATGPSGGALPRLYLFPTGNAFHGSCLCAEVAEAAAPPQRDRIHYIMETLSQVTDTAEMLSNEDGTTTNVSTLLKDLEDLVAVEDPYNGETVVRLITKPFIMDDEAEEVRSWQI